MASQFLIDGDLFVGRPDGNGPEQWVESLAGQPMNARVFASEADALVEGEPDPGASGAEPRRC